MIRQSFKIEVELADDYSSGIVRIDRLREDLDAIAHIATYMAATEHMMTSFAAASNKGFEEALQSLCEGARSNKIKMLEGRMQQ